MASEMFTTNCAARRIVYFDRESEERRIPIWHAADPQTAIRNKNTVDLENKSA